MFSGALAYMKTGLERARIYMMIDRRAMMRKHWNRTTLAQGGLDPVGDDEMATPLVLLRHGPACSRSAPAPSIAGWRADAGGGLSRACVAVVTGSPWVAMPGRVSRP